MVINDDLEWEYEDGWWKFGSFDNLDFLIWKNFEGGLIIKLWKSFFMGKLNSDGWGRYVDECRCVGYVRWCSDESFEGSKKLLNLLYRWLSDDGKMDFFESKVVFLEKRFWDE